MTQEKKRPKDRASWDARYAEGDLPWDSGVADSHLRGVIEAHGVKPGKVLEVGCGTGTNVVWLAEQGFTPVGMDLSPTAIARARARAADAGVRCDLMAADFLVDAVPGGPFDFVYDRGCLHVFDTADERSRFAARVADLLVPGGIWHSLIGSTDGPPRDTGPPRHSAVAIATAVEPHFEILALTSSVFDDERHRHTRAWVLVARRRPAAP